MAVRGTRLSAAAAHHRRITRVCQASGVLGALSLVVATRMESTAIPVPWVVAFFVIALSFFQVTPLRLTHEDESESLQLEEAFFVPMAVLLTAPQVLLALGAAVAFGHLWKRRGLWKGVFNVGQLMGSALVGLAATHLVGTDGSTVREVGAAVVGGAAFSLATSLGVAGVITVAQQANFRAILLDGARVRVATVVGSLSLGVLILLAGGAHHWALPITMIPIVMLQLGYAGAVEQWRQRRQLEALYDAAVSIRSSMELREVREHLITAAQRLLDAETARLVSPDAPLLPGVLRAEVDADTAVEVEHRIGGGEWAERDEKLLMALSGVAAGALHNAQLFEQIKHQALYDSLTGLPNQVLFEDRVTQALTQSRRTGEPLALLFLDLDRFKNVNDSLGHTLGNELLQQVAVRLLETVRSGDTVARMGGDEFTLLLPRIRQVADAGLVAEKLLEAFKDPFELDGQRLFVTPSIGISVHPDNGARYDSLLKNADTAMYRAKENGRNGYELYQAEMNAQAYARLSLEGDLRNAIERDELFVVYQPQVDIASGGVIAAEALVRWRHPTLGMVGPNDFIPLAEETGLVIDLDAWVLRQACRQAQAWVDAGLRPLRVAVNISGRHFQQTRLTETVKSALAESGLSPSLLEIEVTEGVAVDERGQAMGMLEELRNIGVQVAIDDFGTGYSIIGRLRQFPVDKVKIDKSFIDEIVGGQEAPLVAAMIAMAHGLKLEVVAEGVETPEQLAFLRRHGCDQVQGYLFSRPVEPAHIQDLLERAAPLVAVGA